MTIRVFLNNKRGVGPDRPNVTQNECLTGEALGNILEVWTLRQRKAPRLFLTEGGNRE